MVPIPLHDHIRRQSFSLFTFLLISTNIFTFLAELRLRNHIDQVIFYLGIIPARYTVPQIALEHTTSGLLIPFFASMFLHGGWLHLAGNMLFLFVFGRSIEDRFGHGQFLMLYFLSGFGAAVIDILFNMGSRVPTIGASGAIAGILGAYLVSFPTARITTLIPLFVFFWTLRIPALLVLVYWFAIQFVAGYQMLAIESATTGGVAWWAHVGGFILGMLLALAMPKRQRRVAQVWPW